jgi:uncharacterized protein
MIRTFLLFLAFLVAAPALAQDYPALTGRVVDTANLLDPQQEQALTQKLVALEDASSRQLVVLTLPNLGGRAIEDYGVGLGRHWKIGQEGTNNGVILIVAVEERKMRIEVGYGLEGVMTDALSSRIIRDRIRPPFRDGDFPGGINAGVDAIIEQLQAPPEAAEQRALEAAQAEAGSGDGSSFIPLIFWVLVLGFILVPMLIRGMRGKKYRGRRGRSGPVVIWGPGLGSGGSGGGWSSGSSWGSGGGSSWGGGGGGFSGGGGSFGGGGASGGW